MTLVAYFDIELHQIDINTLPRWRPIERGLHEKTKRFITNGNNHLVNR